MIARRSLKTHVTAFGLGALLVSTIGGPALAQDKGSLNPQPMPALAHPDDPKTPAKQLFGRKTTAAAMKPQTIGFYSKGCLAGAAALPINGNQYWYDSRIHPQDQRKDTLSVDFNLTDRHRVLFRRNNYSFKEYQPLDGGTMRELEARTREEHRAFAYFKM